MANDPKQSIYDVSKHHTKPDKMPWQAADRIKQLEQERNNAIDTNRARENEIIGLEQKIARLEAERNELKADAARYRWLRNHGHINLITETPSMSIGRGPFICMQLPSVNQANTVVLFAEAANAAIDAAIAKGEKNATP